MRISQSFLKDFYRPVCGGILEAKYVTGTYPDQTTPARNLGKFFEYLATGYIRKGEEPPTPEYYIKSGNGYSAGDMKPEYQQAAKQANRFKEVLNRFGYPSFGGILKYGDLEGIYDVLCATVWEGYEVPVLIDLKFSDLLYDRWNEYGWGRDKFEAAARDLETNDLLTVLKKYPLLWQPLLYCYIYFKSFGVYPEWYWYIASPKSDDVIFRKLSVSQAVRDAFAALIPQLIVEINLLLNSGGFSYMPSYNICNRCPLECSKRVTMPEIEVITL